MTPELIQAAVALADVLARENQALAALDLRRAAGMLDAKQRATAGFVAAQARLAAGAATPDAAKLAAELEGLATRNRRLLEHAIAVQGRLIGTLARAVPRALSPAPRYNAAGTIAGIALAPPVALSARA